MVLSEVPQYPRAGRRAAVLGHPIAHSLSPVLHTAAYAALGLTDWTYRAIDVDEPDLAGRLAELRAADDGGWAGWSLTMPLKRVVRPLLVRESELARDVGAVNTVLVAPDGFEGYNTDVHGIVEAFGECGVHAGGPDGAGAPRRRATVLGGGATAASAIAALRELGCHDPVVHVRSPGRAQDVVAAAGRLGVEARLAPFEPAAMIESVSRADLVVSTLPAGVADTLVTDGVVAAVDRRRPVLLDVVYDPWPTPLAAAWTAHGAPAVGGFVMLVHQAYGQVHLMTGLRPPVTAMRAAGEAALQGRRAALAATPSA
jgi:shikimate dehydrogenase